MKWICFYQFTIHMVLPMHNTIGRFYEDGHLFLAKYGDDKWKINLCTKLNFSKLIFFIRTLIWD